MKCLLWQSFISLFPAPAGVILLRTLDLRKGLPFSRTCGGDPFANAK